jgi:hypothetical protein
VTRTWRATDACGNTAEGSQKVTVEDHTPPTITTMANKIVECGSAWTFDAPSASDTCGSATITVLNTVTNTTGHCGNSFDVTRTWRATDACGNTTDGSQKVTVEDHTPPTLLCKPDRTVQAGVAWSFDEPVATDTCGAVTVQIVNTVTNTTDPNTMVATRTWQASDACGNASTCQQAITVLLDQLAQGPVDLGSAATFGVLAGSTVTSTGATTVNGDLGVSPGTTLIGTPTVNGSTYLGDGTAAQAQLDLTASYDDLAGRTAGAIPVAGDLGGQTLTPGLYTSISSLEISSGNLTLDAQGDTNAIFIIQIGSTLTTTSGSQVILSGGAQAANIFWQVGASATLGTNSVFEGTILADQSITLLSGATLDGRALALNGSVILDGNIIGLAIPGDTTAPTVSAKVPVNAATSVDIACQIAGTFSEAMDRSTINTATFTLRQGTTPLAGTVSYTDTTATFTPAAKLAPLTTYTVTITTGARDLAGNPLALDFVWSFTTAATPAGQAPVDLGSSTDFGVLAGSTITSTGTTTVNGDLGISPGTTLTGTPTVNGSTYLGDGTAAQAQLDLTAAYDDLAGRTIGAIPVAGDLGGQTLTPGLYTSTSSLEISSGNLTLDAQGDTNAIFIIQIGSTLTTTSGSQVILSGGAQAANIFWQVEGSATLGTNSVFEGTILADQSITLLNGATLDGRALALNGSVTLDANTTITNPTATTTSALVLQSAAAATGPYSDAAGQSVNIPTQAITVPQSGGMRYYRLRSNAALKITAITISGTNVVLTFH